MNTIKPSSHVTRAKTNPTYNQLPIAQLPTTNSPQQTYQQQIYQ